MACCDGFESGLEPGIGFDTVQLRSLDERSDARPCGSAFVVTGEQCVFAIQGDRPGEILDTVVVRRLVSTPVSATSY